MDLSYSNNPLKIDSNKKYHNNFYPNIDTKNKALIIFAWFELVATIILVLIVIANSLSNDTSLASTFGISLAILLYGILIFVLLLVISEMARNIQELRYKIDLISKNEKE